MRRTLPLLFSIFLVLTALVEMTHTHAQAADGPCPVVCLSNCCGAFAANPDSSSSFVPADTVVIAAVSAAQVFVFRLSDEEIFHPPALS